MYVIAQTFRKENSDCSTPIRIRESFLENTNTNLDHYFKEKMIQFCR